MKPILLGILLSTVILIPCLSLASDYTWKQYSSSYVESLIQDNKVVVVSVTAEWCGTCKYNDLTFWSRTDFLSDLESSGVVFVKADMTQDNPAADRLLEINRRSGIPFTIVYGPKKHNGIILPVLVTKSSLVKAIAAVK